MIKTRWLRRGSNIFDSGFSGENSFIQLCGGELDNLFDIPTNAKSIRLWIMEEETAESIPMRLTKGKYSQFVRVGNKDLSQNRRIQMLSFTWSHLRDKCGENKTYHVEVEWR